MNTYNAQYLAAAKINSCGQQTAYEYDLLGKIIKQTDETGMIDYTYDASGNITEVKQLYDEWKYYENIQGNVEKGWSAYQYLKRFVQYLKDNET